MPLRAVRRAVDACRVVQRSGPASHFAHKGVQLRLRRDPKCSKSFQEPQANWTLAQLGCLLAGFLQCQAFVSA